jgi:glutamine amidotransferase
MAGLREVGGEEVIDKRVAGGRPVLGICVGLQIMFERGLEHGVDTPGLGQWPGTVARLEAPILPHMGWNTVDVASGSPLFRGVESERFYFVHSYAATTWLLDDTGSLPAPLVSYATHGQKFVAAVENGPLSATQFHPEKSGEAGLALLRNWVTSLV